MQMETHSEEEGEVVTPMQTYQLYLEELGRSKDVTYAIWQTAQRLNISEERVHELLDVAEYKLGEERVYEDTSRAMKG